MIKVVVSFPINIIVILVHVHWPLYLYCSSNIATIIIYYKNWNTIHTNMHIHRHATIIITSLNYSYYIIHYTLYITYIIHTYIIHTSYIILLLSMSNTVAAATTRASSAQAQSTIECLLTKVVCLVQLTNPKPYIGLWCNLVPVKS